MDRQRGDKASQWYERQGNAAARVRPNPFPPSHIPYLLFRGYRSNMSLGKIDVLRSIKRLGQRGTHFQFRQFREDLRVATTDRNDAAVIYNTLTTLVDDDIVEEVSGNRKRNKYYRVKNEDGLRALTGYPVPAGNGGARPAAGASDRLAESRPAFGQFSIDSNTWKQGWRATGRLVVVARCNSESDCVENSLSLTMFQAPEKVIL